MRVFEEIQGILSANSKGPENLQRSWGNVTFPFLPPGTAHALHITLIPDDVTLLIIITSTIC